MPYVDCRFANAATSSFSFFTEPSIASPVMAIRSGFSAFTFATTRSRKSRLSVSPMWMSVSWTMRSPSSPLPRPLIDTVTGTTVGVPRATRKPQMSAGIARPTTNAGCATFHCAAPVDACATPQSTRSENAVAVRTTPNAPIQTKPTHWTFTATARGSVRPRIIPSGMHANATHSATHARPAHGCGRPEPVMSRTPR